MDEYCEVINESVGNSKIKVYRPILTAEEKIRREQIFADVVGNLLNCKITIWEETTKEEVIIELKQKQLKKKGA